MTGWRRLIALPIAFGCVAAQSPTTSSDIETCMARMLRLTAPGPPEVDLLTSLSSLCEQIGLARYRAAQESATAEIYAAQMSQNTIVLWLVVTLTLAGVVLAAVQLFATYRLTMQGKGTLSDTSEASIEKGKLVVRSSVVGVIILALSFAFFSMYVLYVYQIVEPGAQAAAPRDAAGGEQVSN